MKSLVAILVLFFLFEGCMNNRIDYPETRKDNVVDEYFGTVVEDPYRWLEDDNSVETTDWVKRQNEITFGFLESLSESRDKIETRLEEIINYPKQGTPREKSEYWVVSRNDGLQNQNVLYYSSSLDGEQKVLIDPNKLSEDGTIALSGYDITADGRYLVYMIARSGSDWNEIFVKNLKSGELLSDHIQWVKFSGLTCYENGFYYSAYDQPVAGSELSQENKGQKVFYHKIGTSQKEDELIYHNPDNPSAMASVYMDLEKNYLFLSRSVSTSGNALSVKKVGDKSFKSIVDNYESENTIVEVLNDVIYMMTTKDAPNKKIVALRYESLKEESWDVFIPEAESVINEIAFCGNRWFINYMVDAKSKIEMRSENGEKVGELNLPGICSAGGFSGKPGRDFLFYSFSSFNTPGEIYKYNINIDESSLYFRPELKFNPDDITVKQEFYSSKDGTQVPMFIVHKKGLKLDGKNPTLLYGYGGFNISLTPSFSAGNMVFIEAGGVFAMANLRGGGEYGEKWHKAGTKMQKQNVFDDFIAGAEYLIDSGYTNSDQLAIRGGSNGGLLVGAVVNQRPELFKVALPAVGVMDMLRYHKFTIGYAWASDYGRSDDSKEMFDYLYQYSPYHAVKMDGDYPAILATTADHDDRVVPAHTFKYMARIQEHNKGTLPTLVRIDTKAGHGGGKPIAKVIEEYADIWAFTFHFIGIDY